MPRLHPTTLIKASHENPLLPLLLKECRTLSSSRNELRWLREHARSTRHPAWKTRLTSMCHQRSRGYPLQYILGDQPFGDLEILCRPGVLIPRPDTESYVYQACKEIKQIATALGKDNTATPEPETEPELESESARNDSNGAPPHPPPLRILDLCTGTGCIPLLLHTLLSPQFPLQILAIDINPKALTLARENLHHNLRLGLLNQRASADIQFHRADVLAQDQDQEQHQGQNHDQNQNEEQGQEQEKAIPSVKTILKEYFTNQTPKDPNPNPNPNTDQKLGYDCDLLISNPPYISRKDFRNGTTARSVRLFEPFSALVPPDIYTSALSTANTNTNTTPEIRAEDIFYDRILEISAHLRSRVTVLECGDIAQAERVVAMHAASTSASARNDAARFEVQVWPSRGEDMERYGFHVGEGSRCVIITRVEERERERRRT